MQLSSGGWLLYGPRNMNEESTNILKRPILPSLKEIRFVVHVIVVIIVIGVTRML